MKASTMTEAEKTAATERAKFEAEKAAAFEEADRKAGFLGVALSKGLTKDQAGKLYTLAGPEWTDPLEAFTSVTKSLGMDIGTKPVAGGGGRNSVPGELEYTPEFVDEMISKHGPGWYETNRAKVREWQASHIQHAGIRRLS